MRTWTAESTGSPSEAWEKLSRPGRWHEWAPHLRGAWGLSGDDGEVEAGRRGAVKLLGAVPVPVAITAKDAERREWTWRVARVVDMDHRVEPGRAVIDACNKVIAEMCARAAKIWKIDVADVIWEDGKARPASQWKGASSLEAAIADPVIGQDTTLLDPALARRG